MFYWDCVIVIFYILKHTHTHPHTRTHTHTFKFSLSAHAKLYSISVKHTHFNNCIHRTLLCFAIKKLQRISSENISVSKKNPSYITAVGTPESVTIPYHNCADVIIIQLVSSMMQTVISWGTFHDKERHFVKTTYELGESEKKAEYKMNFHSAN